MRTRDRTARSTGNEDWAKAARERRTPNGGQRDDFYFVDVGLVEVMCHLNPHPLKNKRVRHPKADFEMFDGSNLREKIGTELRLCFCDFAAQNKFPS
jgi:hypothetical protein